MSGYVLPFVLLVGLNMPLLNWAASSLYNETHSHLGATEAVFCVNNTLPHPVYVNFTSDNCYRCKSTSLIRVKADLFDCTSLDVDFGFRLFFHVDISGDGVFLNGSCAKYANESIKIEEKGGLIVTIDSQNECLFQNQRGVWPYTPIIVAACLFAALALAAFIYQKFLTNWRGCKGCCKPADPESLVKSDLGNPEDANVNPDNTQRSQPPDTRNLFPVAKTVAGQHRRLRSLDAFRGLSLVIMIFVNYRGGSYWFFKHSRWNGLTVADLVFPWFDFILGTSAAISLNSLDRRDISRWRIFLKVIRRFVILFALGLIISNSSPDVSMLRIPGVLQRLAASYLGVAVIHLALSPKRDRNADKVFAPVREIVNHWAEWLAAFSLVGLWLGLTFGLPVPNCKSGYLGPGGNGDHGDYENCTGGAAGFIDRWVLSKNHVFSHPTCKDLYETGSYDPEGILGTLNSIVLAFLGMHAGRIFLTHREDWPRLRRLVIAGLICGAIGTGLAGGQKNGGVIPINKNLWSLSYILVMAGTAYILLSLCYFLIDMKKVWRGAPFVYPGMNSIAVYCGHELVDGHFPFAYSWPGEMNHANELASSLIGTTLWVLIAYYMYIIDFFVKI
eukprot:m.310317 g.310317  ORF g.310317 m.310317 type:complete len:615 (+) comp50868_c0_seq1:21-1865(+)